MAFNNYLEDENDKPYFKLNSLAYYYDKMEGFAKAVDGSAKALNLTKEEVEKRLTLYIEQNKNELNQRFTQNKNELDQRLAQWDGKLETFDSSVETLLSEWVDNGTLNTIIDSTLIDQRIEPVAALLDETGRKSFETDFVELTKNLNYFSEMSLIKTHDAAMQQFEVYLKNEDTTQKYLFIKPDAYFKLSGVEITKKTVVPKRENISIAAMTLTGNWTLGSTDTVTKFAKSIGDTAETSVTIGSSGKLTINHFADNRGGIFEVTVDGLNPVTFSTYNTTVATLQKQIYSNLAPGTYALKLTFKGDDPNNAPEGGVSRGWATSVTSSGVPNNFIVVDSSTETTSTTRTLANTSNKEFAFRIGPAGGTNSQWIPQHATATTFKRSEPLFILDGVGKSISDFNINEEVKFKNFKFLQDVYGRNPESGDVNLVNVKTVHTITLDGNINISGSMNVLQPTDIYDSYVIMAPVNNQIFDVLQTGWGNKYPAIKTDNSVTFLEEDSKCKNYVFLSSTSDSFVAYRHTDERKNFAKDSGANLNGESFLNHRDENIAKQYINIFNPQTLPVGYKYRWSGDYVTGSIRNAYDLLLE